VGFEAARLRRRAAARLGLCAGGAVEEIFQRGDAGAVAVDAMLPAAELPGERQAILDLKWSGTGRYRERLETGTHLQLAIYATLVEQSLRLGKEVALPRFDRTTNTYLACQINELPKDLALGRFGIREPTKSCGEMRLNRLDFILVPGVAFDLHGRRLGRGKGYYDQILAAARGKTCGVAFDEQIVREVPVEPHDSDVNCILTPTRWIEL
jgi:hypothetical protein